MAETDITQHPKPQPTPSDPATPHKPGETWVPDTVETVEGPKNPDEAPKVEDPKK
jgi:hypothetical protein